jgi:CheY-like chemotaxis protein
MGNSDKTVSSTKMVIVVEDETLIRELIVEVLNSENFVVLEAGDAAEAIRLMSARASELSLMFTDVNMPGAMNGLQLAYYVHDRWPWIALLIASGKRRPLATETPLLSRLISKPYSHALMVNHIKALCC